MGAQYLIFWSSLKSMPYEYKELHTFKYNWQALSVAVRVGQNDSWQIFLSPCMTPPLSGLILTMSSDEDVLSSISHV